MKQVHVLLATTVATLFAGAVVADTHAVPATDTGTKAGSPKVAAARETPAKRAALNSIDRHQADLVDLSDRIWAYAETALRETRSVRARRSDQYVGEVQLAVGHLRTAHQPARRMERLAAFVPGQPDQHRA